ncbi:unnamed protein product [Brassicogethes aeneus]|uniref:Polyprenal reductase n=1 Tax=Brassicogethes aeneus TaxID=1431903 RepID=A0A9P0FLL0_BRAAE|nr:unnamed protein product [Brassicogethes aeneus]
MNFILLIFSFFTTFIIFYGSLINYFENYLPVFFVQTFRYGKFAYNGENASKLCIEVPKSWFRHFYKLAIVTQTYVLFLVSSVYIFKHEVPMWVEEFLDLVCGEDRVAFNSATKVYISVVLLTLQVYRRYYDTHYVSIYGKSSKINFSQYLVGVLHYPLACMALLCESPKFAYSEPELEEVNIQSLTKLDVFFIAVFLLSWYHQHVCTKILANLRTNKKGVIVTEEHRLPEGDWFNYLSCPHQTAEILMYFSLCVLMKYNITWFFVFCWVFSNQVETILLSHWWYQKTFDKFPKSRKALIPFMY